MPYDEKVNDWASWACHTLANALALPPVPGRCDFDHEVHEAFTMLSICPVEVRQFWMDDYGVPEVAYVAWKMVNDIAGEVRT